MKHRWLDLFLGLASIQSSLSSAFGAAVSPPTLHSSQSMSDVKTPSPVNEKGGVFSPRLQISPRAVLPERKSVIFDASDTRRALDDWDLEDYVLVATIDGSLYALDRHSGATRWVIHGDGPVVRSGGTKYFDAEPGNATNNVRTGVEQRPIWIVQPVEGGQLFLFDEEFGLVVEFLFLPKADQ